MERKIFYDEIYEDIIRSIQKFEDDDVSERYACLYDQKQPPEMFYEKRCS